MDNPVEVAFTAEGEPLATVDIFISRPQPHRRDHLLHRGGRLSLLRTVLQGVQAHRRPAAALWPPRLGGAVRLDAVSRRRPSGTEYRDNLFSAQFNTRAFSGTSWSATAPPSGSATRTSCLERPRFPSDRRAGRRRRQPAGHRHRRLVPHRLPDVADRQARDRGAIYRVRRKGAARPADPRGLALAWDELTTAALTPLLDDPRFAVRDRAVDRLALRVPRRCRSSSELLRRGPSARARRNAVWVLTRMDTPEARAVLGQALGDPDLSVRLTAAHAVGLNRVPEVLPQSADDGGWGPARRPPRRGHGAGPAQATRGRRLPLRTA